MAEKMDSRINGFLHNWVKDYFVLKTHSDTSPCQTEGCSTSLVC